MKKRQYLCNMITLAKHIELLLLDHDCVIVPGLGGFIANHIDAKYGGEEELFQPPYRTIGFNQQLQVNDGLLVQSYMMAYDTSYPFANLQMEQDLEKMLHELEMTGEYTLENIGTLKKGINQNITLVAPESGVLTPALYGLQSYAIKSLSSVVKEKDIAQKLLAGTATMRIVEEKDKELPEKPQSSKRQDFVIRLNRRWIDFGISVAAAAVLLFCFSYPAIKNVGSETDTVVAICTPMPQNPIQMKEQVSSAKPATKVAETKVEKGTKEQRQTASEEKAVREEKAVKEEKKEKTQPATTEAPHFSIVMASYVSQANAETFINQLAKAGYGEGKYIKNGKVSRILYSEYATEADAQKALQTLRKENTEFAEAWILEL